MIHIPEQYISKLLYENLYRITHNRNNNTYNACCPFCKEGNSWGRRKRFFYIPEKSRAYCHNCGYNEGPLKFTIDLTGKTIPEVVDDVKNFDVSIDEFIPSTDNKKKDIKVSSVPENCINLFDNQQIEFYKDNTAVKKAISIIEKRRLNTAVNRPHALYISLDDMVHKNRLIIPFYDTNNNIIFYQSRKIENLYTLNKSKYISKMYSDRSLYGVHNVKSDIDYIFIFEGPIDSFFVYNGIAVCGITDRSAKIFSAFQNEQINKFKLFKQIFVLDNQYKDNASLKKTQFLIDQGHTVFIWPVELKPFKDFNDICVFLKKDEISTDFIVKNSFSGLEANIKLSELMRNGISDH